MNKAIRLSKLNMDIQQCMTTFMGSSIVKEGMQGKLDKLIAERDAIQSGRTGEAYVPPFVPKDVADKYKHVSQSISLAESFNDTVTASEDEEDFFKPKPKIKKEPEAPSPKQNKQQLQPSSASKASLGKLPKTMPSIDEMRRPAFLKEEMFRGPYDEIEDDEQMPTYEQISEELDNPKSSPKRLNEGKVSVSLTMKDLQRLVHEEAMRLMPQLIQEYFDSRVIKEEVQIKVGNTIFSGNLSPLPKKK